MARCNSVKLALWISSASEPNIENHPRVTVLAGPRQRFWVSTLWKAERTATEWTLVEPSRFLNLSKVQYKHLQVPGELHANFTWEGVR
jgi:hypothetical protein